MCSGSRRRMQHPYEVRVQTPQQVLWQGLKVGVQEHHCLKASAAWREMFSSPHGGWHGWAGWAVGGRVAGGVVPAQHSPNLLVPR